MRDQPGRGVDTRAESAAEASQLDREPGPASHVEQPVSGIDAQPMVQSDVLSRQLPGSLSVAKSTAWRRLCGSIQKSTIPGVSPSAWRRLRGVASEQAHYESAARLIGAAAALRVRVAGRPPDTEQARNSTVERVLAQALGPQDADRLIHAGQTMPAQQAADFAMAVASGAHTR